MRGKRDVGDEREEKKIEEEKGRENERQGNGSNDKEEEMEEKKGRKSRRQERMKGEREEK